MEKNKLYFPSFLHFSPLFQIIKSYFPPLFFLLIFNLLSFFSIPNIVKRKVIEGKGKTSVQLIFNVLMLIHQSIVCISMATARTINTVKCLVFKINNLFTELNGGEKEFKISLLEIYRAVVPDK